MYQKYHTGKYFSTTNFAMAVYRPEKESNEESRNRNSLITKEKVKRICSGQGYRQKDHETPTGGKTFQNSVADDLELFFEDIQLGRKPLSLAWTYFLPELTLKEFELVENKDEEYMGSFKLLNNADVSETEMNLSSSKYSKYVSAYCRRKTIAIDGKPTYELKFQGMVYQKIFQILFVVLISTEILYFFDRNRINQGSFLKINSK